MNSESPSWQACSCVSRKYTMRACVRLHQCTQRLHLLHLRPAEEDGWQKLRIPQRALSLGHDLTGATLRAHPSSVAVQEQGCAALYNLTANNCWDGKYGIRDNYKLIISVFAAWRL